MPSVEVDGRAVEYAVRRSARARRARIVVDWQRNVEVVLPRGAPTAAADRLLVEHRRWLARQVARPLPAFRLGLQRDDAVWLHGRALPVPAGNTAIWYRERAREAVVRAVAREANRLGLRYGRISIRAQRTRWASCSSRGDLCFNWRLVLAPEGVLDYVVVHELCHRRRGDHSPAFWRLVADARPGYPDEKRWLQAHGLELLQYRPPQGSGKLAPWGTGGRPSTATAR